MSTGARRSTFVHSSSLTIGALLEVAELLAGKCSAGEQTDPGAVEPRTLSDLP
ncbi:hypothetical protein [Streptomyces sp. NPDC005046]